VVAGSDIYRREEGVPLPFPMHEDTRNEGAHVVHTGGPHDSVLRLPVIPPPES